MYTKKICLLISILAVIVIITAGFIVAKGNQTKPLQAEAIKQEELQNADAALKAAGTPENVIDTLSKSQKHYIATNLNEGGSFEVWKTSMFEPAFWGETVDAKEMEFTVLVYSLEDSGAGEKQLFTFFRGPESDWGVNGDSYILEFGEGWNINFAYDTTLALYLENDVETRKLDEYLTMIAQLSDVETGVTGRCGYTIPFKDGKAVKGNTYIGCTMLYATKYNPEASDILSISYTHDESVVYTKGIPLSY